MNVLAGIALLIANVGIGTSAYSLLKEEYPKWIALVVLIAFIVIGILTAVTILKRKPFRYGRGN